ncbi:MAG: VWA domain-containing protein [Bacilli bacterium]|nr:VWA domain-containing protein [Bacilli bacterium]
MPNYMTDEDLLINPSPRIPLCVCIDVSRSMTHKDGDDVNRFDELKAGLADLINIIRDDAMMSSSLEIAVVAFNDEAAVLHPFSSAENLDVNSLKPSLSGNSDLGAGVLRSLELCDERKQAYREHAIDYYQPWLVIMTDGKPSGSAPDWKERIKKAQQETRTREENNKLTTICVLCGGDKDIGSVEEAKDQVAVETLRKFTANPVQNFSGAGYKGLFRWLGRSMSNSMSGVRPDFSTILSNEDDWVTDW